MSSRVLEIAGVTKNYSALRPLRIQALALAEGERVALGGLDGPAAELMVNLVTGATVPDEGIVRVLGRNTAEITDGNEWVSSLERFGIVSERAVLLEGATLLQNLALPFTLELDPVPADVQARVQTLAAECGIGAEWLEVRAGDAPPHVRARVHLARAVALDPALLLLEHPTATIAEAERRPLAADIVRVCAARRLAALAITQDQPFAAAVADRALMLQPATGAMKTWRRWF